MVGLPAFRSLSRLAATAPTARVLNLGLIAKMRAEAVPPEMRLFRSAMLERAIIVKHRLRPDEASIFRSARGSATKLLIPMDPDNLDVGAANIFVGEPGWKTRLSSTVDFAHLPDKGARDVRVLEALDAIPSLDPFLAREQLASNGFVVDHSYFAISANDLRMMSEFVISQIVPLVTLCLGESLNTASESKRLTDKLLNAELDETMEPLRLTLRIAPDQFREGMFCWKGFLYYKWVLATQMSDAGALAKSIRNVNYVGPATMDEKIYLSNIRHSLPESIMRSVASVRLMLKDYDDAFRELTEAANPTSFRDFLLNAPTVFNKVGDRLGALQHVTSFWQYRRPREGGSQLTAPELADILRDFSHSIGESEKRVQQRPAAAEAT